MSRVGYNNPGVHAWGTFEEALAAAWRLGRPIAIMECPEVTPYDTGWHLVETWAVPHYEEQGYVLRGGLELSLVEL